MQKKNQGRRYDSSGFYWALMYQPSRRAKPYISAIYPKHGDARSRAVDCNRHWKEQGLGENGLVSWTVKRFKFYFRGTEIDAYAHEFQRQEVSGSQNISMLKPELLGKVFGVDVIAAPYPPEVRIWNGSREYAAAMSFAKKHKE